MSLINTDRIKLPSNCSPLSLSTRQAQPKLHLCSGLCQFTDKPACKALAASKQSHSTKCFGNPRGSYLQNITNPACLPFSPRCWPFFIPLLLLYPTIWSSLSASPSTTTDPFLIGRGSLTDVKDNSRGRKHASTQNISFWAISQEWITHIRYGTTFLCLLCRWTSRNRDRLFFNPHARNSTSCFTEMLETTHHDCLLPLASQKFWPCPEPRCWPAAQKGDGGTSCPEPTHRGR